MFCIAGLDSSFWRVYITCFSQQLVTSVFRELWFTLPPEGLDQKEALIRRVTNITAVVSRATCTSTCISSLNMHADSATICLARVATMVAQPLAE